MSQLEVFLAWKVVGNGGTCVDGRGEGLTRPHELLRRRLRQRVLSSPYVFHHRGGKRIRSIATSWKNATIAAKCPGKRFHDLRRLAATDLIDANVDEKVAQQLLGHRTTSIFRRYNITRKEHLEDAARKLARYWKVQRRHTLDIPDEEASF